MKLGKVLVVRFSSIGDIIVCSSIVRCVKLQGASELHFVVKKKFESVVADNLYIDKIITLEDSQTELHEQLRKEKYDLVIDLQKNLRSRRLKNALAVPSISYDKLRWKKWIWVNFKINKMPKIHLVDRYF